MNFAAPLVLLLLPLPLWPRPLLLRAALQANLPLPRPPLLRPPRPRLLRRQPPLASLLPRQHSPALFLLRLPNLRGRLPPGCPLCAALPPARLSQMLPLLRLLQRRRLLRRPLPLRPLPLRRAAMCP